MTNIKYPYLYAWDRMMGSNTGWSKVMQQEAEKDKAPKDAIYKSVDGVWATYGEIKSLDTKRTIWHKVLNLGFDAGPEPTEGDFLDGN